MSKGRANKAKAEYLQGLEEWNSFLSRSLDIIYFNFKYYQYGANGGQSFEEWQKEEILADLNNKLHDFSSKSIAELIMERKLEIYDSYPRDSKFSLPKALDFNGIKWARLRLTGARRLIGFFIQDVDLAGTGLQKGLIKNSFYIVFLDKEHEFAPYTKK